jgi:hypothetical protein
MRHLIIPDLHQDVGFLDRILEAHPLNAFTSVVLLGDLFDAKDPLNEGPEVLRLLLIRIKEMVGILGAKLQIMLGNHDVLYYHGRVPSFGYELLRSYYGTVSYALLELAGSPAWDVVWERFSICTLVDDVLLSHAGIKREAWDDAMTARENVNRINDNMQLLVDISGELNPIFKAGFVRGGDMDRGGPLWLDFDHEFEDELPLMQVVGHTVGNTWRRKGRSYCLDARQRCYAILDAEGLHPFWSESK